MSARPNTNWEGLLVGTETLAALFHHGAAVPVIWIVGLILIIAGVVTMVRRGIVLGAILVVLGIVLGGLQLL
ncbi:MAG: hypothetical protein ABSD97_06320 [Acidimicrobiales bacterium]